MDWRDALYHTVHQYPGGAAALAPRLGKSAATLSHEVRPPAGSAFKVGVQTWLDVQHLTGDLRSLQAVCSEFNGMFVQLPTGADVGEDTMLHAAKVAREFADVLREVSDRVSDGHVSDNDRGAIEKEAGELVAALQHMLRHVRALNLADKPGHLKVAA